MKHTKIWKLFSSIKLAIWLLSIIALVSLVGTFIPQNEGQDFYISRFGQIGYHTLLKTGLIDIYSAGWFLLLLVLFALNLFVCLINRFSLKGRLLGTTLTHISILIILFGALIGMLFGERGFFMINKAEEISSFSGRNKQQVDLGFSLKLNDFIYNEYIDPKEKLLVLPREEGGFCDMHGKKDKEPLARTFIAQIPVDTNMEYSVGDTGYTIKVLRYLPDFVMDTVTKTAVSRSSSPNNPALEIEIKNKEGVIKKTWVFARFPEMHQQVSESFKLVYNWQMRRPKDFISDVSVIKDGKVELRKKIRVNDPLRYGGYSFFQASYDTDNLNWSGLRVSNDPGVGVVYLGFILLIIGLVVIFYLNPLLVRK